ncbi:amidohydrolase [Micromonospora sp. NPDC050397]|uniref:amidohydrolase n=1 Tax=Micromonospora sp. NPDC050397 TaxID=3364279 RepID=UPI0038500218
MLAFDRLPRAGLQLSERSYQDIRDATRSDRYQIDVAQRHRRRSRLSQSHPIHSDREFDVTSALTLPSGSPLASSPPEPPPGAAPLPYDLDQLLALRTPDLVATRRHIHAHPELSGHEFATAALIVAELSAAGLEPRLLPKGNGVVCDIGDRPTGPVIALRADIDALPLTDAKDVPYRSTVDGVCHACGHDVHTTVLLGTGLLLARLAVQGGLDGRVRLIFQPAEETVPSGAPEVIAAGGLTDVAEIYALHCAPQLAAGTVGVRSGPLTAAADTIEVHLTGAGGHTARPHLTADLVYALGRVVVDVPGLLTRRMDPRSALSLVWGAVHAGTAPNAIPSDGFVRGTVRTLSRDAWREAPALLPELVREVLVGTGAKADVRYSRGFPPVHNEERATATISAAAARVLGPDRVLPAEISMGSEDFSFYLDHVPGAMIRLGTGDPDSNVRLDTHHPGFDVDERAIGYGVRVLTQTALAALAGGRTAVPYDREADR